MAESVDAANSKSVARKGVPAQVSLGHRFPCLTLAQDIRVHNRRRAAINTSVESSYFVMPMLMKEIPCPCRFRCHRARVHPRLRQSSEILEKGRAFADEKGVAHTDLLDARLFPDMLPLSRANPARLRRFAVHRFALSQIEIAPIADEEKTFDDLQKRIAATVALLKTVPANAMDGRENAEVVIQRQSGPMTFTGKDYVLGFALPNFYFHVTTAYDVLRNKGVPIGKRDFLGRQ